jgi:hypothetical protein
MRCKTKGGGKMDEKHEASGQKQKMEIEDSDQEHVEGLIVHSDKEIVCPVCGRQLHDMNLVDAEGIIDDKIYAAGGVLIVDSKVRLLCEFEHRYDGDWITIEEPHELVAVVDAEFNGTGECIRFVITDIRPG